jgi:hypothetical protein
MFEKYKNIWHFQDFLKEQNENYYQENIKEIFNKLKRFKLFHDLNIYRLKALLRTYIADNLYEIFEEGHYTFIDDILIENLYGKKDYKCICRIINLDKDISQYNRKIDILKRCYDDDVDLHKNKIEIIENINISTINKLKFLYPLNHSIQQYVKDHYDANEINQEYEKELQYHFTDCYCFSDESKNLPCLLQILHLFRNINNPLMDSYLQKNNWYSWYNWKILVENGYNLLKDKNDILHELTKSPVKITWIDLIKYLLENNATIDNNERKSFKTDSKKVLKLLEEYGIKSLDDFATKPQNRDDFRE